MDIFQQFTFVIKQKEQYIDLRIRNNTNKCDRQKTINRYYIYEEIYK